MSYDFDLFVIGAGSGGVRAARFAAGYGAKVAIAESRYLGGTCVNVGCVPKKLMSYAASYENEFSLAQSFGWMQQEAKFSWPQLIENKNQEIKRLNGIYENLLVNSGVTLLNGHAKVTGPNQVELAGKSYTAKHILLSTGGWPVIPDIPGKEFITDSNQVFYLPEQPQRVLVIGGGYIAAEFASIFNGLGSNVTISYRGELFLRGFDLELRQHMQKIMQGQGIQLNFNSQVASIVKTSNELEVTFADGSKQKFDCVFCAIGRRPMFDDLGLENVDIALTNSGRIQVNELYETTQNSILAIGDIIEGPELTPVALAEGMAVAKRLFNPETYQPVSYDNIATAIFTLPNIATVGLTEEQAQELGYSTDIYTSSFRPMKMSFSTLQERIFMKLIVNRQTDKVLGCHMIGPDAGELIQGLAVAIKAGATKTVFDETIGIHPTAAEEFVTMRTVTRQN